MTKKMKHLSLIGVAKKNSKNVRKNRTPGRKMLPKSGEIMVKVTFQMVFLMWRWGSATFQGGRKAQNVARHSVVEWRPFFHR